MQTTFTRNAVFSAALAAAFSLNASFATAQEGTTYISGSVGITSAADSPDSLNGNTTFERGYDLSLGLGYALSNNIRGETELARAKVGIDTIALPGLNGGDPQAATGSISATSLMLNGYYDFDAEFAVTPYIGAGAGLSNVAVHNSFVPGTTGTNDSDRVMAWQLKVGVKRALSDNLDLTVGYQYFDTQSLSFTSNGGTNYKTDGAKRQSISVGLIHRF